MKKFFAQIKPVPTAFGFAAIVLTVLFWLQTPDHPHVIELSIAMAGIIGVFLTIGLFCTKEWAQKSFYLWTFTFTTGFTWLLSIGGSYFMEFGIALSLVSLMAVALTPYKKLGGTLQYL